MESTKKRRLTFDGTGDGVDFLTKVNLMNALKEYEGENLTMSLAASCLQGNAFDVYLRLSDQKETARTLIKLKPNCSPNTRLDAWTVKKRLWNLRTEQD